MEAIIHYTVIPAKRQYIAKNCIKKIYNEVNFFYLRKFFVTKIINFIYRIGRKKLFPIVYKLYINKILIIYYMDFRFRQCCNDRFMFMVETGGKLGLAHRKENNKGGIDKQS